MTLSAAQKAKVACWFLAAERFEHLIGTKKDKAVSRHGNPGLGDLGLPVPL